MLILVAGALRWHIGRRRELAASALGQDLPSTAPRALSAGADLDASRMVGKDGLDAYGYPLSEPNHLRLRAMLQAGRYAELNGEIADYQSQFEGDFHKENWVLAAFAAFALADPAMEARLNDWIRSTPDSFAAYAARGAYFIEIGWTARGNEFAGKTSPEQFKRMAEMHKRAWADLEQAIHLRPKLIAAYTALMRVGSANSVSGVQMKQWLGLSLAMCPDCFYVRSVYLRTRRPRWGGSYNEMAGFAAEAARRSTNPRMGVLAGFADEDRCQTAIDGDQAAALVFCDRAVSQGDSAPFFELRGKVRGNLHNTAGAIADYDRALELSPQRADVLALRGSQLAGDKQWERAERDLLLARRLDSFVPKLQARFSYLVESLVHEASQLEKSGFPGDALKLYDRALRIDPNHAYARTFRNRAAAAPAIVAMPQPDDTFEAHKQADDALVMQGRFSAIVEMWDTFIARHPDDARAHLERGGAHANLGHGDAAIADMAKACELGLDKACTIREVLRRRFSR